MERWKSTILAYHVMALLTPNGQASIKIRENAYQWIDPLSDEILVDGHLLLNKALKLMRPDVQTNVYAELTKIKAIKPVDHGYNVVKWHSVMESKCIAIEQKVPGLYHESQFIMDYLDVSLNIKAKSFKAEVNIIRNRYLCGNPDRWNATSICGEIIKTYNNMSEDGTWKREIGEKDQIIALSTKVAELQAKLENQDKHVVALATQAKKEPSSVPAIEGEAGSTRHSKREPYTVAAWRLTKKNDKVCMHGKDYFGAQVIIGAAPLSTTGCMLITNRAIVNLGGLAWMNAKKVIIVNQKRLHLNLRKLPLGNLLSTINFATHSALRLAFLPKQSIKSGRMPRETSRSKSRGE